MYTILIADDNAAIRASVRTCIQENLEAQVCGVAENGAEAVEKVKELNPEIVILDYQMPVLDGLRRTDSNYASLSSGHQDHFVHDVCI